MRRYVLLSALFLSGLLPWAAGQVNAATTEVHIFPAVKYVAQSSPTFSVDVRVENVLTYPEHVRYEETNVDSDLPLGFAPEVRASYTETNVDTDLTVGADAASERRAQGFRVTEASPVNRVLVWTKKVGDPADGLRVELRGDSGGLPDTSPSGLLSESSVASGEDDITTSYAWVAFDLLTPPILSPGTQYHLVVRRTLPPDYWVPGNHYVWGADTSSPAYADGAASVAFYDEGGEVWVWSAQAPAADHAFVVDTAVLERAQGFQMDWGSAVNRVFLWLKRVGELTLDDGFLKVEIRDDSGGAPGALLGESTAAPVYECQDAAPPTVNTDLALGDSASTQQRGQGFQVDGSGPIGRVLLWVKKVGAPTDGLKVEIRRDSGGMPDSSPGGLLAESAVVAGADIGAAYDWWVAFDMLSQPVLASGTQYHVVLKRTLGPNPTNYYVWGADLAADYDDGAAAVYNGAAWQATVPEVDHAFALIPPPVCIDLLGTSYAWVPFDLKVPQLSTGAQYHLVLKWLDKPETPSYIDWGADTSSPGYAEGVAIEYYGGLTWVEATPPADHAFEVAYACPLDPEDPSGSTGPCGLGGFEIEIGFETAEFTYDDITEGDFLTSTGRSLIPCSHPGGHDPANGKVVYRCTTSGATPLGPEGSGVLATATFTALGSGGLLNVGGNTVLFDINSIPLAHDTQGNQVIVEDLATDDEDGDGCTDIEEAGGDPLLGGHRNPHSAWDFYDVPVPANPDPTANGARNGAVTMGDVLAVLAYVGTFEGGPPTVGGVDYDSLKDGDWFDGVQQVMYPDGATDAWDKVGRRYDRAPTWPFSGWSGAPSGAVTMSDVLAVLLQVGHSCANPP